MAKPSKFIFLTLGLFGFIFWHLARQMLQIRQDGWYVGQVNLYGDLVFHLSLINKFLESNKILPQSPILAQEKINYPIFADFLTAQIARVTSIDFALFITTFAAGIIVIFVGRLFIVNFIKNEKIVFITFLLFFINGGLGFFYFFRDLLTSDKSLVDFLFNMPSQYTDIKERGFWWINSFLAYFLPQRGFLFAFPITLTTLLLLYNGFKKTKKNYFILAGCLAGVLPLVQAHSLLLLFLLSLFFVPLTIYFAKNKKETILNWLIFSIVTAFLAFPMFSAISSTDNPLKYLRFDPGWTSEENIIWFWVKNLGLFAPTLVLSLIWLYRKNRYLFILYLPFLAIFFLANLFVFQPWDFDNSKLLIYWFFASSIVVAFFLYDQFFSENNAKKLAGIILLLLMIFAGSLDLARTFTPVTNYRVFESSDTEIANAIKNLTTPDSIFVTAANHNHPIPALTGRSTVLGFHGWVWSHGLSYSQRVDDIKKIYLGGQTAEGLINYYRISYITVGPSEKAEFIINENYFEKYPKIILNKEWQIYDVSHLWTDSNR